MNQENYQKVANVLAKVAMTPQEREQKQLMEQMKRTLEKQRITPEMNLPPLDFLFRMLGRPCFPRGELVSVTGKAKSGKTFFLSLVMAACSAREAVGIQAAERPLRCLWYDTEQSRQSTYEILKGRIMPIVTASEGEGAFQPEMYDVFNVRGKDCDERLALLEAAVINCQPDLAVVDGVCDLVADINDGTRVKPVVERLMRMAQDHRCCIVCAIHQNKASEDRNPRGWIGTELNNKSFEVYACELLKPQMVFAVEQLLSRRYRMDGLFCFTIDGQGMPHQAEAPVTAADSRSTQRQESHPPMNTQYASWKDGETVIDLRSLFYDALKGGSRYYSDLQTTVMTLLGCKETGFWNKLFKDAKNQHIVINMTNGQGKNVWALPPREEAPADLFAEGDAAPPY